ncbi:efflux RND transporter periplasmic adaptor subunit [Poseidonibacter sp.]|uniref:efflux RND transporter periplasmic adaptor subunit n=1 Tax=Poseidonibacter sp. TaxID=2321188 RepID=UPI003C722312
MKKLIFLALLFSYINAQESINSRAIITSVDKTTLSSELSGNIIYLNKLEGDYFTKGEVLVKLNCDVYKAKKNKVAIEKNIAYLKYKKNKELESYKSIGKFEVDISREEYRKQESEFQIASINVKRCNIFAPYNGRVVTRKANQFQSIKPNEEIIEIIGIDKLEAKTFVPSIWLQWLKKGNEIDLAIDETNTTIKAIIKEIGSVVDPVSQTVLVRVTLKKPYENIIPGMSATAIFKINK